MDQRTLERKLKFIEDYKKASNAATGSKYDSNANVTCKNIATLQCELSKKDLIDINRALTRKYYNQLYGDGSADEYFKLLESHYYYSHDESSLMPYCVALSLYPYILNGLKDLGGSSAPPQHANSYVGGMINLVFLIASQFAGAVAIPEFLPYFDYFLRKDYGDDYYENLDEVIEFGKNRKITLRKKIEDWFQQFDYSINQPAGARNYQSPFINTSYFDKYYFESIFKDFVFPDGEEPKWESTKELQKIFMKWFNQERTKEILTFPVESYNILTDSETKEYKDKEMADFAAEMWSEGHSFFMYQSDSADSLSSCCRLRNGIDENIFSYTLGAGGIETGSKKVITLNLNRIVQDWYKAYKENGITLPEFITPFVETARKALNAWNEKLWDDYRSGMLPVYTAGFIDLDKQYLTLGVNGFVEAAEFLMTVDSDYNGIEISPWNEKYQMLARDILGTIKTLNQAARDDHHKYNTEFVPAENAAKKLYDWDKKDGYLVPSGRNLYNSYFYIVEDPTVDAVSKFYYQGKGFATECDGGVANHVGLDTHLSKEQYRKLMDIAVKAGCNYFTFNIPNTICNDCGHIDKRMLKSCPICGSENVDYATRVIGYLKRISNFSEPRQEEAGIRHYDTAENVEKCLNTTDTQ